jgi:long-chain acyl-CoA synthetase
VGRPYAWESIYPAGLAWDLDPPRHSLAEHLARCTAKYAERTFLDYRGAQVSYAEFGRKARQAAAGLLRLGIARGQRIALYLPNTPYHPIGFFGVAMTGGVVVHLSPVDTPRELAHKLEDSGARVLITTNLAPMLAIARGLLAAGHIDRLIVGDESAFGPPAAVPFTPIPVDDPRICAFHALLDAPLPNTWPALDPDELAVLQYTGGTTGIPKGAMHSHATLVAAVASAEQFVLGQLPDYGAEVERVIIVLPLFHIFALLLLIWEMGRGSVLSLHPRFDVQAVLHDIEVNRATNFPGVPTMWIALNAVPGVEQRDFSSLRHVGSGGAPLPPEVAQRFERLVGLRLGGGWGMTETATAGTGHLRKGVYRAGSIGVPLPGIEIQVVALDDPRRELAPGETGELRIRGPNIFKGYWNRPEETASAFVDGFFLTGDIGRMDPDGIFHLTDRKRELIISAGFNVYPRVIEDAIYAHPSVAEAAVIGIPDPYRGEVPKAFIALRSGAAPLTLADLRSFLRDRLNDHELPAALELRAALPKTGVGKLSKKELVAEESARAREAR